MLYRSSAAAGALQQRWRHLVAAISIAVVLLYLRLNRGMRFECDDIEADAVVDGTGAAWRRFGSATASGAAPTPSRSPPTRTGSDAGTASRALLGSCGLLSPPAQTASHASQCTSHT
ncbi:hypothetical protein XOCgx_4313 [Xanthomonas oryzae pv. oryzicola]|nr:hypothetical protein XOCgx_4313 [Xanthomonas oryzae pv. oryzicola]